MVKDDGSTTSVRQSVATRLIVSYLCYHLNAVAQTEDDREGRHKCLTAVLACAFLFRGFYLGLAHVLDTLCFGLFSFVTLPFI